VCHGNICRSPMAEFVMKDLVRKAGLSDRFYIESAATSSEEVWGGRGNPVYPPARAKLLEHGIDPGRKRARRTTREDYGRFDYLIGMDRANLHNMRRIYGGDPEEKISQLLDYAGRFGQEVADPWYTDDFDATWNDVLEGCTALLLDIREKKRI
ncbi:MAG: low molecular weight protein-tyrosine-phosphatase, partial [Eubacteriales bacterium]|nr:low molecular weight protein-tyrosine-phosphatase [Eubacteriales bacterium]